MERERGELCIIFITSQFSPPENLALKARVSQQTSSYLPPKPRQACHGFTWESPH